MANTDTSKKEIWECVSNIFKDYGIDAGKISNRVGDHLVADILQTLISNGYLSIENKEEEKNG